MNEAPGRHEIESLRAPSAAIGFSPARVMAMVERHLYLLSSSPVRLIDLAYWPTVQLLTWSFLQLYVGRTSQLPVLAAGTLIGGILLWDVLFRGQLGFSMSFLEEVWSRNLGHLLMSPLRPGEFVLSLMIMSILRLMIGLVPAVLIATTFFGFDIATLSFAIPFLFINLMLTAWSVGLVTSGLILRNGLAAETIAWSAMFAMMPFACISYPVTTLPSLLQPIAWALPPTYVFEAMRAMLIGNTFRLDLLVESLALNLLWIGFGSLAFRALLASARRAGSLLSMGE
ncbi:MAG: ABC transporter permease [Hyphomicrobiales bacterium]|nr:ABC transporter permease [Hyphomicrobiales bacterium]